MSTDIERAGEGFGVRVYKRNMKSERTNFNGIRDIVCAEAINCKEQGRKNCM